jgi:hypothetical protein
MRVATIAFAILALAAGLKAALHWYKSTVETPPPMDLISSSIRDTETKLTPVEAWLANIAKKNRKAAMWTAIAVVLGAISSILGALSC